MDTMTELDSETGITVDGHAFDIARHDGEITISNPSTGNHRTFRVRTQRKGKLAGERIVSLLTGPDNSNDYTGFGFVTADGTIAVWKSKRGETTAAGHVESDWEKFARILSRPLLFAGRLEYLASLHCRRCGLKLTHPESIVDGVGPICRKKIS